MEGKGELAAAMAKRNARLSIGSDTSRDSTSSMDIGPSVDSNDDTRGVKTDLPVGSQSSTAKNFFKAKDQENITRRASLGQEEILRKEKEDAKKEAQERADKKKAFLERMAVFDSKK
jgi:hypothetical protein